MKRRQLDDNDREFIRACKEELADGGTVGVLCEAWKRPLMEAEFTDDELARITWRGEVAGG